MYRYTTPTIPITIEDLDFDTVDLFRVAIQNGPVENLFVINADDPRVDAETNTITIELTQEQTAALTMIPWKPVYLKCEPQADGSAIIDKDDPFVQDLPATADGKIYIFLGVAYSATNIELNINHSVYYHDGTAIRIYTGPIS